METYLYLRHFLVISRLLEKPDTAHMIWRPVPSKLQPVGQDRTHILMITVTVFCPVREGK